MPGPPLFGREHHFEILDEAFAASRAGARVLVLVHGPAGAGKSALLQAFADRARSEGAVVVSSRGEPSTLPFAALAPIVEGLVPRSAEALSPDLARLFAGAPASLDLDPWEERRRAAVALRSLVAAAGATASLVLTLDDLDRAGADCESLLADALLLADAPAALVLVSYRSDAPAPLGFVEDLRARLGFGDDLGDVREVLVGPLSPTGSRALARDLLQASSSSSPERDDAARSIARRSKGFPRAIEALVKGDPVEPPAAPPVDPASLGDAATGARGARASLAFATAAALFKDAALLPELAEAQALAGDLTLAADTALAASLPALAADHLAAAGLSSEARRAAEPALRSLGLSLPSSSAVAGLKGSFHRLRLAFGGLELHPAASPDDRARAALTWSLLPTAPDLARSFEQTDRHLVLALRSGDRDLAVRALAAAALGTLGSPRSLSLARRARALAAEPEAPGPSAWCSLLASGEALHQHRFRDASLFAGRALDLARKAPPDRQLFASSVTALATARLLLGELDDLARDLPGLALEAHRRGSVIAAAALRAGVLGSLAIARDQPLAARRAAEDSLGRLPPTSHSFGPVHAAALFTRVAASLYVADPVRAEADLAQAFPALVESPSFASPLVRVVALHARAAVMLASAPHGPDAARRVRVAERNVEALEREPGPLAVASTLALRASLTLARGDRHAASLRFSDAELAFEALDLRVHAAAARYRRGQALGLESGRSMLEGADAWLRGRGVPRPDRFAQVICPIAEGW